jgi:chromosome segregation ATPase
MYFCKESWITIAVGKMEELILLRSKVRDLINAYAGLGEELDKVRQEKEKLAVELNRREKEIDDLKKEVNRVELSGAILGDGEKSREAKKRINDLVREIDNCIALLNNI